MTTEESRETVQIMLRYLSPREARALSLALWQSVGEKTENSSVRETLEAIMKLAESQQLPLARKHVYVGWFLIFLSHWLIALGNFAAAIWLIVCAVTPLSAPDWAIALPLTTFVCWTIVSRKYDCPLSTLEDKYRVYFGFPPIRAFLAAYLVRPLRRAWTLEQPSIVKNGRSS